MYLTIIEYLHEKKKLKLYYLGIMVWHKDRQRQFGTKRMGPNFFVTHGQYDPTYEYIYYVLIFDEIFIFDKYTVTHGSM